MRMSGWRRWLLWWLSLSLALLPLAGCETLGGGPGTVVLAGVVIDGERLASAQEAAAVLRVWRGGAALPVQAGMALMPGDRVETGPRAYAVVRWPSGSEVYMRPGSAADIGSLRRAIGEFFVKVRGLFAVETDFVRAGAKGTAYLVRTGPGGSVLVTVFDGRVQVDSLQGRWLPVTMERGSTAVAHPQAPQPVAAAPAELQQTQAWVERIEKLVPVRSYSGLGVAITAVTIGALIAAILGGKSGGDRGSTPATPAGRGAAPAGTPAPAPAGTPDSQPTPAPIRLR
ncbi:FecR domain-containing protein [Azohydromonas lata]|uniref:FecR domain-containing protein n=1 Tax=Azohydromonas lata TaxID=45677 RepID=UPI000834C751|nr:FecR domain-containing protein [Azohydromonas lata]